MGDLGTEKLGIGLGPGSGLATLRLPGLVGAEEVIGRGEEI